jgi:membrane fusion protein, multidrug efflux system
MNEPEPRDLRHQLRRAGLVVAIIAGVVMAAGIGLRLHAQTNVRQWTEEQAIPTVSLVSPQTGAISQELVLPGTLRAYFDAPIYARVPGYLKHWYVDIGAHVRAGELLAEIETPELDQQIKQAEADLATAKANENLAQTTAQRWQHMLTSESVSKQEADEKVGSYAAKRADLDAAQANFERLRQMGAFKRIVAPFDGIVTARNTDVGALINAGAGGNGQELFRVADMHAARIYVDVPQTDTARIHVGMTAQLQIPERPGVFVPAKVADLSNAIRESSGTMEVELMADNQEGQLLPGEYAEVHFLIPSLKGVFSLPTTALLFRQEGLQVATADASNHIVLKDIHLARENGAVVEVNAGISATDRVVDNPPDAIQNGEAVRIAASNAGAHL